MKRLIPIALLLALVACAKTEPPAPEAAPPPPTATTAPAPPAAAPEPSASVAATPEVPVEEDFENEANDQVTVKTLDSQLDALEKEIRAN